MRVYTYIDTQKVVFKILGVVSDSKVELVCE